MKDKPLKAQDIAKMAGISGSDMKRIAENYDQVIPSRVLGRVKLYEQKAVGIVERISSMETAGTSPDDIVRELGGRVARKSTKETTREKIKKSRSDGGREKKQTVPVESIRPVPPAPGSGAALGREDKTAFLELKMDKLTNRVEQLEKELQNEKDARERDREEFQKIIRDISESIDATGRWVDYFDRAIEDFSAGQDEFNSRTMEWIDYTEKEIEFLKRPFWKRRR